MDKAKVKGRIEQIQEKVILDLEQAYARDISSADIDEAETKDPEDFSHQQEWNEMARRLQLHLNKSRDDLKYIKRLPLNDLDTVGEGALVTTNKYMFFVGIATHPFKFEGKTIVGISTEAPIYMSMREKKAGDKFVFGGKTYSIVNVQ